MTSSPWLVPSPSSPSSFRPGPPGAGVAALFARGALTSALGRQRMRLQVALDSRMLPLFAGA